MSFNGDSRAAVIGTAAAYAFSFTLIAGYAIKSGITASRRGSFLQYTVLGVFCTNCCSIFAYFAVIFIVGTDSKHGCNVATLVGVWAYFFSKFAHHLFLAERLHIVYTNDRPRHKSPVYLSLLGVVFVGLGCAAFVTYSRRAILHPPYNQCYMGFDMASTLYILLLIVIVDSIFTIAFVLPLFRARFEHARTLAIRSIIATLLSLLGVVADFGYLQPIGGQVRAWTMWLAVIGDLTFNATVIVVISNYKMRDEQSSTQPSGVFQIPNTLQFLAEFGGDTVAIGIPQLGREVGGRKVEREPSGDEEKVG